MIHNTYKKIKELRQKRGFSQSYMAKELDISRPTYIQIEKGIKDLNTSEIKKCADIFGISPETLMKGGDVSIHIDIEKETKKEKKELDIRISVPQNRVDKFKEVLLYILKKVGGKPNVGMTVLYKLLYFIDFDFYEKYEEQLIGATYIKNHHGPTPLLFEKIIKGMIKDNEVEITKSKFYQYPQTKYLINPQTEPDLSILNGLEKEHIDWEIQRLSDMTAKELSDLSHKDVPWITADENKQLDYESVFYRTDDTSVRKYDDDEL